MSALIINAPTPSHLAIFQDLLPDNDLASGMHGGYPVMSIKGSKWRLKEGGEERPIYIPGTNDLAPSIRVVLLKANPNLSKSFYAGGYVEGSNEAPDCYSNDGIAPANDAPSPQCVTCAQCPNNEWGSKISEDGKKGRLCADVRRVAILPSEDLNHAPILLRVPAASLQDLAIYGRNLNRCGRPYAAVVTKLAFDANAAYPKIVFSFERDLSAEEAQVVVSRLSDPLVEDVIGSSVDLPATVAAQPAAPAAPAQPQTVQPPRPRAQRAARTAAPAQPAPQAQPANVVNMPQQAAQPVSEVVDAVVKGEQTVVGGDIASDIDAALASLNFSM